jgi:hypothetical protein
MPTAKEFRISLEVRPAESSPTREEIELRAYQIYMERGGADGQDVEDWLQAERELVERSTPAQKVRAAAA